ncbi:hypothetical protein AGMMS50222_10690 [Endomicrobiia bacterium]|nr:hypothetical protein AGMMS50222_10690 [Endomicrobiia bacterium]
MPPHSIVLHSTVVLNSETSGSDGAPSLPAETSADADEALDVLSADEDDDDELDELLDEEAEDAGAGAETNTDAGETLDEVVPVQVPNVGAPVIVTVLPVAKTLLLSHLSP